jgi:large subunit ribosomal protein L13
VNIYKTYSARPSDIQKNWWVIDAKNLVLGRAASLIAKLLMGKHKSTYTPHMDCGDHVVVINADKVALTGKKLENKKFYWHSSYPGGIKERTMRQRLESDQPERVLRKAVERMMSKGPLREKRMGNLKVYKDAQHPHEAQAPKPYDVAALNTKNVRA